MSNKSGSLREFGKFRLDAEKLVLWCEEKPVNLALKEIELLCVLTEHKGEVVTKRELLDRIWADSFVEESNLSRHIYVLRKTLKELGVEGVIETVPRRGYRFSADVKNLPDGAVVIEKHTHSRTTIEIEDAPPNAHSSRPSDRFRSAIAAFAVIAKKLLLRSRKRMRSTEHSVVKCERSTRL